MQAPIHIIGAGLSGAGVALALLDTKRPLTLIEQNATYPRLPEHLLMSLNAHTAAWLNTHNITLPHQKWIDQLLLSTSNNHIKLNASELDLPHLGFTCYGHELLHAIQTAITPHITWMPNEQVSHIQGSELMLYNTKHQKKQTLKSQFNIACAPIDALPSPKTSHHPKVTLMAYTQGTLHDKNTAYQHIDADGIYGCLPTPDHRLCIVFTGNHIPSWTQADDLGAQHIENIFNRRVQISSDLSSWHTHHYTPHYMPEPYLGNTLILGQHAHRPSAIGGQGFNLTVSDIHALSEHINNFTQPNFKQYWKDRIPMHETILNMNQRTQNSHAHRHIGRALHALAWSRSLKQAFFRPMVLGHV